LGYIYLGVRVRILIIILSKIKVSKEKVAPAKDNDTVLALKKIGLVRMIKNDFAMRAIKAEEEGWDEKKLKGLLGEKQERLGIFEGDEIEGELEAGQSSGLINEILTVEKVFEKLINEYDGVIKNLKY
jgi:enoyl-[acyl-carrier protein] reductase II